MRYQELLESNQFDTPDEVISFIQNNCQPYLKENPNNKNILYRGTNSSEQCYIKSIRTDRNPSGSNKSIHDIFDDAFKKAGFVATRSNSLFVTPSVYQASEYGNVYVVFPIGDFNYTYSNEVVDLLNETSNIINKLGFVISNDIINYVDEKKNELHPQIFKYLGYLFILTQLSKELYGDRYEIFVHPDKVKVNWEKLPDLLSELYTNTNISNADSEVMISSKQALLIDKRYYLSNIHEKVV